MKVLLLQLLVSVVIYSGMTQAAPLNGMQNDSNWPQAAVEAQESNLPVIVIFDAENCAYCEMLNQQVINPMRADGEFKGRAIIRHFDINSGGKVTDFDGDRVRSRRFVSRYNVFATPTLVFLDANGKQLTRPIVGYNGLEDYKDRLEHSLTESQALLISPNLTGRAVAGPPQQ